MMGYDKLGKIKNDVPSTQRIQEEEAEFGHITKNKSKNKGTASVIDGIRYEETPAEDISNKAVLKSFLGPLSDGKVGSEQSNSFKRRSSRSNSRRRSVASKRGRSKS